MKKYFITLVLIVTLSTLQTNTNVTTRTMSDIKPSIPFISSIKEKQISIERFARFEIVDVCHISSSKTYMLVTKLNPRSLQVQYINTNMTAIDGLFYDEYGYVGVALGSYFGEIGTRYVFTLDTDIQLKVVKVEHKADVHTNNGCEQKWDKSVIEFVVDPITNKVWIGGNTYIANGNFNNLEQYNGNIKNILKIIESDIHVLTIKGHYE